MSITDYTFRIILLFIPGIIAFIIVDNLTIHKTTKTQHWIVYSLLLGFLSHMPWMILSEILSKKCGVAPVQFITNLVNKDTSINLNEILIASISALFLGAVISKGINDRWLYKISRVLKISNKFPEIDAWANCIAIYKPSWIRIRDRGNGLIYQGRLISTSDANERDGIVLEGVTVYTEDVKENFSTEVIYIPRKMENLTIELI